MKHSKSLDANQILELIFIYLTEISSLRKHDEIIILLADMGRALSNADRCSVWVVSDDRKSIWTKVAHGMDMVQIPIESGIVGASILNQEKIIIEDVYKDRRFNSEIDKKTGYRTKSMMVIPMFNNDDEIIGAFQVINNRSSEGIFDKRDMERMMLASTYAAETLVAVKLSFEIEETQREVVFTLGTIVESRSKETGNHVKRVAEYSQILALAYGLSNEEAELLKQASPMHDIGKLAIPDAVLNKPSGYNQSDKEIMSKHPVLGYEMIKHSKRPLLQAAATISHEHHEKWDGTGYPNGLKGEEIHIYGRITALADVFDALGSDRVYKKAWDDAKILELFRRERGKHFDPHLIDLFFENIDKFYEVRDTFIDKYTVKENKESKNIKILGAYGTKAKGFGTSSFYLNAKNVIDAGSLLNTLEDSCTKIENIWLTHSHLDHISDIAYIIDNYFVQRKVSLNICALSETIKAIKEHFLNDIIWPDFSKISIDGSEKMVVTYQEIEFDVEYKIGKNEYIRAYETDHTVQSCGYIYKNENSSVIISADTHSLESTISEIKRDRTITSLVVECSFPSSMNNLAKKSKHLTPNILFDKLKELETKDLNLYINHIKPQFLEEIQNEIESKHSEIGAKILKDGEIINF